MRCRRITKDGTIVWFGSTGTKQVLYDFGFTCGDDKICGAPYKYKNIIMKPSIYVYNTMPTYKHLALFVDENDKHANYSYKKEAVKDSLTQRLSVIKNELWYDYQYGLPLTDKVRNKAIMDAYVIKIILAHPDVLDIEGFESIQEKNNYSCYFIVNTIYGQIELGM